MWRMVFGAAALIALAGPVSAADMRLPVYKAPAAVPAWSWTGCYGGGQVGGLLNTQQWTNRTPGGAFSDQSLGGHEVERGLVGVQAGCDYQFAGGFLVGLKGDYAWTDAVGMHDSTREIGVNYHSRVDSLASVTGRFGYAWDRLLGYVRGGGAWQHDDYWATTIITGPAYFGRETRAGWTVGVGAEYAFTNYLSGFIEYDYYDFGTSRVAFTPMLVGLRPAFVDVKEWTSAVRIGLNLRFGG
jgi:outer membrane immunogenic protein